MITRHHNFPSQHVAPRHVDVWLPPDYTADPTRRYPVLYMHDGQNLFDPADATFGVSWEVDRTMERLIAADNTPPAIVVGIWNTPLRWPEYRPRRPFAILSPRARERVLVQTGDPLSDAYLSFIVDELKPMIDGSYRTLAGQPHTFIMGSSMGGLISLYALCEYPEVFGGAGCLSTHWPSVEGVMPPYLRERLPEPQTHRIYFDYGTHTLDALYAPLQQEVNVIMSERGYLPGSQWTTLCFRGTGHFESYWAKRLEIPLRFLLAGA